MRIEVEEKGYTEVDNYIPEGEDDDFALAFGPMDGVVSEDEDDVFAQAFGRMDGVVAEDEDDEFALAGPMEDWDEVFVSTWWDAEIWLCLLSVYQSICDLFSYALFMCRLSYVELVLFINNAYRIL